MDNLEVIATATRSHPFYPGMAQQIQLAFNHDTGEIMPINEMGNVGMSELPREIDIPSAIWIIQNHPLSKKHYYNVAIL